MELSSDKNSTNHDVILFTSFESVLGKIKRFFHTIA